MFASVNSAVVDIKAVDIVNMAISTKFNALTITGLAVGASLIGIYVLSKAVLDYKVIFVSKNVVPIVCSVIGIVFVSICLAFTSVANVGAHSQANDATVKLLFSPVQLPFASTSYLPVDTDPVHCTLILVFSIIAQVAALALIVLNAISLFTLCGNLNKAKMNNAIIPNVIAFLFAIIYTVFAILTVKFGLLDIIEQTEVALSFIPIIILDISAFLAMVVSIVQYSLTKNQTINME